MPGCACSAQDEGRDHPADGPGRAVGVIPVKLGDGLFHLSNSLDERECVTDSWGVVWGKRTSNGKGKVNMGAFRVRWGKAPSLRNGR